MSFSTDSNSAAASRRGTHTLGEQPAKREGLQQMFKVIASYFIFYFHLEGGNLARILQNK